MGAGCPAFFFFQSSPSTYVSVVAALVMHVLACLTGSAPEHQFPLHYGVKKGITSVGDRIFEYACMENGWMGGCDGIRIRI